jgi:hypothetical protein
MVLVAVSITDTLLEPAFAMKAFCEALSAAEKTRDDKGRDREQPGRAKVHRLCTAMPGFVT